MMTRWAHICNLNQDLAETERFYCDVICPEKGFNFLKNQPLFGFYIKVGRDSFIEVFKGDPGVMGNIDHIAIETDDIDQVIKRLRLNGFDTSDKKLGVDKSWQS